MKIHDISDAQYNKAHLVPDKKWDGLWCDIDDAIERSGDSSKEKEVACMELRRKKYHRLMYQCSSCGRIYINDENNELNVYEPESKKTSKEILNAI